MTADTAITLHQLLWASPAFLICNTHPAQPGADDEPVFLFRSEGFAEDLGDTYSSNNNN